MKIFLLAMMLFALSFGEFIRNDSTEIVTDGTNGLMWKDDINVSAYARYTWENAIDYCEALSMAGYSDWRLPNINELYSIVNHSAYNPTKYDAFKYGLPGIYWSSTTSEHSRSSAWYSDFKYGDSYSDFKTSKHYIRCVRGGN